MAKGKRTPEERAASAEQRAKRKARHKARKNAGVCVRCGTMPPVNNGNATHCRECLDRRAENRQAKQQQKIEAAKSSLNSEAPYIDSAETVWTAAKWLARATGAGYHGVDQELTDAVFGPFWDALPNGADDLMESGLAGTKLPKVVITQAQADIAYEAGLRAFEQYTERTVQRPKCPKCGDATPDNRTGNDYKCSKCGWEAPPGAFGAIYIAQMATAQ